MAFHYEDDEPQEPTYPLCDLCATSIYDGEGELDSQGHFFHAGYCARHGAAAETETVLEPDQEDGGCN
jgi:hypothetical protein